MFLRFLFYAFGIYFIEMAHNFYCKRGLYHKAHALSNQSDHFFTNKVIAQAFNH